MLLERAKQYAILCQLRSEKASEESRRATEMYQELLQGKTNASVKSVKKRKTKKRIIKKIKLF
jgi:hypothetical protein